MILLVTGGRDYKDLGVVFDSIVAIHQSTPIELLVHGDATGADTLTDDVAKELGINRVKCPANWTKYYKGAGPIRNKLMLDLFPIDLVLAFPGGQGTANMKEQATKRNIPIIEAIELVNL